MTTPLVSVVIPAYNYGHFVAEAVNSALQQTYTNVEVIVVDDGSTDDTAKVLTCFGSSIRYIHQVNKGLSAARNTGIRAAGGEWVAFLDADDLWHSSKIETQLGAVTPYSDISLIGSLASPALPTKLDPSPAVRLLSVRDFLVSIPTGPSGTLVRRKCFDRVGFFDEQLSSIEDRDMWLRIAARFSSAQVQSPCWWYRPHPGQMSRNAARMHDNYTKVLNKFFSEHPEYRELQSLAWSYLFFDSSWCFLAEGNSRLSTAFMLKSLRLRPWSLGDPQLRRLIRARIIGRLVLGDRVFARILPGAAGQ